MNKIFWTTLADNEYQIPAGHSLDELTQTLFGYLASTDPELRDDIAYIVYANWLKQKRYTSEQVRGHVTKLLANLEKGIGETESDSVFLRAFSVLLLAEIVHNDNKAPLLSPADVETILVKGLHYISAEKDPRGHIPVKGWAHALAHTADLLLVLGKNKHTSQASHEYILKAIADKLIHSTNWVYIHGEDERLANAVLTIFTRNLLSPDQIKTWLVSFTSPTWNGAYTNAGLANAFHNTRNFLRSLSESIRTAEDLPNKGQLAQLVYEALDILKPY